MPAILDHVKNATAPPLGAALVGWPWWAVAILLAAAYGPACATSWLDVVDRIHRSPWRQGMSRER